MGKVSVKENKSIYQLTREALGLSRAEATEYIPDNLDFPGMDGVTENRLVKKTEIQRYNLRMLWLWQRDITSPNFVIITAVMNVSSVK